MSFPVWAFPVALPSRRPVNSWVLRSANQSNVLRPDDAMFRKNFEGRVTHEENGKLIGSLILILRGGVTTPLRLRSRFSHPHHLTSDPGTRSGTLSSHMGDWWWNVGEFKIFIARRGISKAYNYLSSSSSIIILILSRLFFFYYGFIII